MHHFSFLSSSLLFSSSSSSSLSSSSLSSSSSATLASSDYRLTISVRYFSALSLSPYGLSPRISIICGKFMVSFSSRVSPSACILSLCFVRSSLVNAYYSETMRLTSSSISQFVSSLYGFWKESSPPIEPYPTRPMFLVIP